MPLKIFHICLITCCFHLSAFYAFGQKQQVDFQFPDGVGGYFTVSLQDEAGNEYILQNQVDLSKSASKALTMKIQVFFNNAGSQGYLFLLKKSGISFNKKVLNITSDFEDQKRSNQLPIVVKFLVVGEGATNIGFDIYYLKDDTAFKVDTYSGKTYTIVNSTTAPGPGEPSTPPVTPPSNNKPAAKPQPAPGIPADEQAFRNCSADDLKCLEQFIRKYPDSKYAEQAKRQILRLSPLQYEVKEVEGNRILVTLINAVSPQIDTIIGLFSDLDESTLQTGSGFLIKPEPGEVVEVRISDPGKPRHVATLAINLQNLLTASLVKDEALFKFFFGGVDPPYLIYLKKDGVLRHKLDVRDTTYQITYAELQKELEEYGGDFGTFDVEAYSDKAGNIVRFTEKIAIDPPKKTDPLIYLAVIVPIVLIIGLVRLLQNRKRKKFEALKEKRKAELEPEFISGQETPEEKTVEEPPVSSTPVVGARESDIKIRSVRSGGAQGSTVNLSHDDFTAMLKEEACTALAMDTHWEDSAVTQIHFSRKSLFDLDRFLRQQNIHEIKEKEGTIPEIGGFLLGKYFLHDDQKTYDVAILHFVPVHPEDHDVYRLEFSVESLATRLGDVQDEFPQYALVGWFHTHPGHGLFLSKPDMTIQEGFFNKPYQFAMEIDSLTENLDTAFFTRDSNGKVFNSEHRKPGAKWFAWTEIEKSTRKRRS